MTNKTTDQKLTHNCLQLYSHVPAFQIGCFYRHCRCAEMSDAGCKQAVQDASAGAIATLGIAA
jgi:hypothetical protein